MVFCKHVKHFAVRPGPPAQQGRVSLLTFLLECCC
jgi:hypothetical protein